MTTFSMSSRPPIVARLAPEVVEYREDGLAVGVTLVEVGSNRFTQSTPSLVGGKQLAIFGNSAHVHILGKLDP